MRLSLPTLLRYCNSGSMALSFNNRLPPLPPPQNLPFAHSDAEAVLRCFFFKKESGRLLPEKCSRLTIVIQLFIPARIPGLMSPHTWADEPAYPGR